MFTEKLLYVHRKTPVEDLGKCLGKYVGNQFQVTGFIYPKLKIDFVFRVLKVLKDLYSVILLILFEFIIFSFFGLLEEIFSFMELSSC